MKSTIIRRFGLVSALTVLGAVSFASTAGAGEGGIAGSAAFTVNDTGGVTGVAVSAAVGKENAAAAAFNYDATNDSGLQNSAWAMGSAGVLNFEVVGDSNGFNVTATQDTDRGTVQGNSFSADTVNIQLGTASGDVLVDNTP